MLFSVFFWCINNISKKVIIIYIFYIVYNIFSTLAITFITGQNRHHMKNNIRYNGNTSNTSVIIFLIGGQLNKNSQQWCFCLGEPPGRFLLLLFFIHFCSSFCCCSSFHFHTTLPCHRHSTLASQAREGLH